jgi:hypothetical protein
MCRVNMIEQNAEERRRGGAGLMDESQIENIDFGWSRAVREYL